MTQAQAALLRRTGVAFLLAQCTLSGSAHAAPSGDYAAIRGPRAPASSAQSPANHWRRIGEDYGFTIYAREIPDSALVAFKGEGILEAPFVKVASVLLDDSRAREWVERVDEMRIIRWLGPTDYLEYSRIQMPPLIQNRDFLTRVQIETDPARHRLVVRSRSQADGQMPEREDTIRGDILVTVFTLDEVEAGKKTRMVAELAVDPKGALPKWVVNLFSRRWPANVFRAMGNQLKKQDIVTPEPFARILKPYER